MSKRKSKTQASGKGSSGAEDTTAKDLMLAKAKLDAARKRNAQAKALIRKDKNTVVKGPERVSKLKEMIVRAKAHTTKSAEDLLKKAAELDKATDVLIKGSQGESKQAGVIYRQEADLRTELNEVRAANKNKVVLVGADGKPIKRGRGIAAKVTFVTALARRQYVVSYGPGENPAAIGARTQDGRVVLELGDKEFSVTVEGGKPTSRAYGAGSIMSVESVVRALTAADEAAQQKAAEKTGT